jgi:hypothetical protein
MTDSTRMTRSAIRKGAWVVDRIEPIVTTWETAWIAPMINGVAVFSLDREHRLTESFRAVHTIYPCHTVVFKSLQGCLDERIPLPALQYLATISVLFIQYLEPTALKEVVLTKKQKSSFFVSEMKLWVSVFECLKEINSRGCWRYNFPHVHPGAALAQLITEGLLIAFVVRGDDSISSADVAVRDEMSITQKLRTDKNPFPKETFTHTFVESCLKIAGPGEGTHFHDEKWQPILKARSTCTAEWRKSKPLTIQIDKGRPDRGWQKKRLPRAKY